MKLYDITPSTDSAGFDLVYREHDDASNTVHVEEIGMSEEAARSVAFHRNILSRANHLFTPSHLSEAQQTKIAAINDKAMQLAIDIMRYVPGADGSAALRLVREAAFTANAGIAKGGIS